MNGIILGIIIVAVIGIVAGVGLSIASIVMAVPKDEKAEALLEKLPGANCGACGFSGCEGYAVAMAKGEAEVGLCSPGGADCAAACGEILGVIASVETKTAVVHCMGNSDFTADKMNYDGIPSCAAAALLAGGVSSCRFGCMGLGDCVRACQYGAIEIVNGLAVINPEKCRGCSLCVAACPKNLISFIPYRDQAIVRCANCDKGASVTKICKVGCIGCMKCVKSCEVGAVKVTNFKATIDPSKCIACGKCVEVCPRKIIEMI
ncbi:MAG: RnfABCDGE type electron transport complex subunit B [Clostridia bacterium]